MSASIAGTDEIAQAAEALRAGLLVAFPTETVYGLGADAESTEALRRLYAAKGRPAAHPVIVHLSSVELIDRYASRVPEAALRLAERFWPGPLTLILPRSGRVPDEVTGGQESVGLRVPDHPLALSLLAAFGRGVAAPSANRFGRLSPTLAEHVRQELGGSVAVILDGGACRVGVESTIVALTTGRPTLLRPGAILAEELAEVLGEMPASPDDHAPRASGTLASHYAPSTPLELCAGSRLPSRIAELSSAGARVAVLLRALDEAAAAVGADGKMLHLRRAPSDAPGYARAIYATLRALDRLGLDRILVEEVPEGGEWSAVADRLRRAAHREA